MSCMIVRLSLLLALLCCAPALAQQNVRVRSRQCRRQARPRRAALPAGRQRPPRRRRDLSWLRRRGPEQHAHGRASEALGLCRAGGRQFLRARAQGCLRPQLADPGRRREARRATSTRPCAGSASRALSIRKRLAFMGYSYGGGVAMLRALSPQFRQYRADRRARRSWSIPIARWPMRWAPSSPCASRPCSPWARSTTGRRCRNARR